MLRGQVDGPAQRDVAGKPPADGAELIDTLQLSPITIGACLASGWMR